YAYAYKGNTPVKLLSTLDNYAFGGGIIRFTYDGTFDNFRFVLRKTSAVTQEELDAHNVTSMIPPYIHMSEMDNYTDKLALKADQTEVDELESKGVIRLSYKANSAIVANLEVGEYGWNDSTKELIKKT